MLIYRQRGILNVKKILPGIMYKIKQLGMQTLMVKYRPLGYERVYLPLCKVADTPFHIQGWLGFSANLFLQVFLNLGIS